VRNELSSLREDRPFSNDSVSCDAVKRWPNKDIQAQSYETEGNLVRKSLLLTNNSSVFGMMPQLFMLRFWHRHELLGILISATVGELNIAAHCIASECF
jgi:hypothetical protein